MVFPDPHSSEFDATISETAMPAPRRLHRLLNGRSVTPAMGATMRLFLSSTEPIFKWEACRFVFPAEGGAPGTCRVHASSGNRLHFIRDANRAEVIFRTRAFAR